MHTADKNAGSQPVGKDSGDNALLRQLTILIPGDGQPKDLNLAHQPSWLDAAGLPDRNQLDKSQ